MSLNDLMLFIVIFGSTFIAVVFPEIGVWFEPFILYLMMFVLFLSFMKIDFSVLLDTSPKALLALGKLVSDQACAIAGGALLGSPLGYSGLCGSDIITLWDFHRCSGSVHGEHP